jgi:leucyl/phenylalanyl-tRNA--protein transferase
VTLFRLPREVAFPEPRLAEPDGLLAVGGDLAPERLVAAYAAGIFPWYSAGQPILWWSPDPRFVIEPERLHVPRSLERTIRRGRYRVTADRAFRQVIEGCAAAARPGQPGTWIVPAMVRAYTRLHQLGLAHSFEAWEGDELAGGLYGVSLGDAFFGESMFARRPDASKVAFVRSVEWLAGQGIWLLDSQLRTDHLARFGATDWPRERYLAALERAMTSATRQGRWSLEPEPLEPGPE